MPEPHPYFFWFWMQQVHMEILWRFSSFMGSCQVYALFFATLRHCILHFTVMVWAYPMQFDTVRVSDCRTADTVRVSQHALWECNSWGQAGLTSGTGRVPLSEHCESAGSSPSSRPVGSPIAGNSFDAKSYLVQSFLSCYLCSPIFEYEEPDLKLFMSLSMHLRPQMGW